MKRCRRLRIVALALGFLASSAALSARAQGADPWTVATEQALDDRAETARAYLGQSLAALAWGRRYAESAARGGGLTGFDLARYQAELDTLIDGLERYLRPEGPPRGSLTEVEITGQFLLEGLRGRAPKQGGEVAP